jgi:hypothetical protein
MTTAAFPDTRNALDLDLSHDAAPPAAEQALATMPPRTEQRVPLLGMALLCLASAVLGVAVDHRFLQPAPPEPKIAFAEQGSVVLESLLARPDLDEVAARRLVGQSLSGVIEKYHRAGYLVLDVTHSSDGQILVEAVPRSAIDITPQMRAAVAQAISRAASAAPAAPAGASAAVAGNPSHPN